MPASIVFRLFAPLLLASGSVCAQFQPALADAPVPWAGYFAAAARADVLPDPLQRCLAYPDLPGSRLPSGHSAAYCQVQFGPRITLDTVAAQLERGETRQLEAAFRRDLERHFSNSDFSEAIHLDLDAFDASARAGALSARWLALAPDSAFAHAARAHHLLETIWGADLEAPDRAALAQAGTALDAALKREPRLVAAAVLQVELLMLAGQAEQRDAAHARGRAVDPGCRDLARAMMVALRPRWGGSIERMKAHAATLAPLTARRPLLANVSVLAIHDEAAILLRERRFAQAAALLKPAALSSTHPEIHGRLAMALDELPQADQWERLAYFIAAGRFSDDDDAVAYERGRLLMHAGDGAWAVRSVRRALLLAPGKATYEQVLGAAYVQARQYAEAEPHFVAAMREPSLRPITLRALVAAMTLGGPPERAERYAEMLTREQPESPHGWLGLGLARRKLGQAGAARGAFERFLRVADRTDPSWSASIRQAEAALAEAGKP